MALDTGIHAGMTFWGATEFVYNDERPRVGLENAMKVWNSL
jgi:hypothetical protein